MILHKKINSEDRVKRKSNVKQLVDILQVDVAGIDENNLDIKTRKKYDTFVTGGSGLPVTSSLFQTIFDQDHELQTSNELMDFTIGVYHDSSIVTTVMERFDANGKPVFPQETLMMREKINIYKQYAQTLIGDSSKSFTCPIESTVASDVINAALFINIKRLFTRDSLDPEEFSFRLHTTGSGNLDTSPTTDLLLFSDSDAENSLRVTSNAGEVGEIKDSSDNPVGLIYYQKGVVVLDAEKVFDGDEILTGTVSSVYSVDSNNNPVSTTAFSGSLVPDFWVSGSIDNILDHICSTRFGRSNNSAFGFINKTGINSTIYFCRLGPNEGNYSSNPTYVDASGSIRAIESDGDDPFSYVTTIGLYNASNELIAVAKTSRPIEKNPEVDLTLSVRIDY